MFLQIDQQHVNSLCMYEILSSESMCHLALDCFYTNCCTGVEYSESAHMSIQNGDGDGWLLYDERVHAMIST